ncbi:hypothetical protein [Streptomyces sp. TRM68367]|uniref:hypothetical protein n=1 Tax=Streptomyces sp. TRM68367 TaxID=2758415 RepID=UPI00165AB492|nr:hypothetical protein [Streptomyces sp. TRM68367]MBC9727484.1 hypothetical protein [Streptomyces sp. TRM68367]
MRVNHDCLQRRTSEFGLDALVSTTAENLTVHGVGGRPGQRRQVLRAQGSEARDAVAAALESAHPGRAGLEELRQVAGRALRTPAARLGRARNRRRGAGNGGRKRRR